MHSSLHNRIETMINLKAFAVVLWLMVLPLQLVPCIFAAQPTEGTKMFYRGVDISMLPVLESAGAKFGDGKMDDLPVLLAANGCNLVRLRLFVDPSGDYTKTYGAVQDLASMLKLAKRVKAAGMGLLLDLHYSDTWADPEHQFKPKAWADLHGEALEKKVQAYTVETLAAFKKAGVMPEMVAVGNEIAPGMLWPDGKISYKGEGAAESWKSFARLINAGIRGVRAAEDAGRTIPVMIHIHGGGRPDAPVWFFEQLTPLVTDFQYIGLSFYPGNRETLGNLSTNLSQLATRFDKDIIVAETAYPNAPIDELKESGLDWPQTPAGQKDFLIELQKAIHETPGGHGRGFIYWYPEAILMPKLWTWREGRLALFDKSGHPLPALEAFADPEKGTSRLSR